MKYRKKASTPSSAPVLGMLYIVEVRLVARVTREKTRHRILMVGCEHADIETKLRWVFDTSVYSEFSISNIEKVREKVHFLSTVITQDDAPVAPIIERGERSEVVPQHQTSLERYDPNLYAVGITTTMLAKDELHALRKVGNAILASASAGHSHSSATLSEDSTVKIEQIARSSGYAQPRDVSNEVNKAHFVRG